MEAAKVSKELTDPIGGSQPQKEFYSFEICGVVTPKVPKMELVSNLKEKVKK